MTMITKDRIIRRNANGSMLHHGAPMPLGGFTRDAAPSGSVVGGVGGESFGYSENNQTMRAFPQGKIGGTDPRREDGAYRHVLARWKTGCEIEIAEDGDSSFHWSGSLRGPARASRKVRPPRIRSAGRRPRGK